MSAKSSPEPGLPAFGVDPHFANVPRLREVSFDAERCARLFTHIGTPPGEVSNVYVHLRPDYKLGYTRAERQALRAEQGEEYDTESASCEFIEPGDLLPNGGVLMTIVYGTHYGVNALLRHEAVHARQILRLKRLHLAAWNALPEPLVPGLEARRDRAEELEADRAMKDPTLKLLSKGTIKVMRSKKRGRIT